MKSGMRLGALATVVVAGVLALSGGPATAAVPSMKAAGYECSGGEIPSGNYSSITVTGACSVAADAVITVVGNINVKAGAELDADSAPSTITVGHNVTAAAGSFVALGCQPPSYTGNSGHACYSDADAPDIRTTITVNGNVTGTDTRAVLLNGVTVNGNVTLTGGGSEIYWSIKNNTIGRNLTVNGMTTTWLGVLFNTVGGNATLTDIVVQDEHPGAPGVYVVRNSVGRNLICSGLTPGVSGGFIPGSVNVVGHKAIGQCASLV